MRDRTATSEKAVTLLFFISLLLSIAQPIVILAFVWNAYLGRFDDPTIAGQASPKGAGVRAETETSLRL
jgi:hypothetical protein